MMALAEISRNRRPEELRKARRCPVGVLRSAAHRRVESRLPVWLLRGVFIIAVHHAFVLGWGGRHGGIVELSEDSCGCVTVSARFTYLLT